MVQVVKSSRQLILIFQLWLIRHTLARSSKPLINPEIGSAYRSFGSKLQYINHDEVQASALQIRKEIEELNRELFEREVQNEILTDANISDPMGYVCQKKIVHVKELQYLDKVVCTTTTGNLCYKTQKTSYSSQYVNECKTHFKKSCWIDMQDTFSVDTITKCITKPEVVCNVTVSGKSVVEECKPFHETVCETKYIEKEITEDHPKCKIVTKEIKLNNGQTMKLPSQECKNEKVTVKKAIPNTVCDSVKRIVCISKSCPKVSQTKVCEDVQKVVPSKKPVERCNLEPYESCNQVAKQHPYLEEDEHCVEVPKENCFQTRVQPQLVNRPIIKKSCTKKPEESYVSETTVSQSFQDTYDAAMNPDICINDSEKKIYTYPFKYNGQQIILRCFLNYVIVQLNNGKNLKVPGVFNATFEEYSNGIGEFHESNYMIPLDVLHYLTAKHGFSILQVRIGIYGGDKIRAREINFVDFEIGSKFEKYVLKSVRPLRKGRQSNDFFRVGAKFSTFDDDQDYVDENCAQVHAGGWWYSGRNDCGQSFLNGFNFKDEDDFQNTDPNILSFWGNTNIQQSFMFVSRPENFDFFK